MVAQDIRLGTWRTPAVIMVCGCLIAILGFGSQHTLLFFAAIVLLIAPLSLALAFPRELIAPPTTGAAPRQQSVMQALSEAFGHRSYVLLVLGFFTCGFQIFFIAVHLPAYLNDRGLPAWTAGWTHA